MNLSVKSALLLAVLSTSPPVAAGDVESVNIANLSPSGSTKNKAIKQCVSVAKKHHAKSARLILSNAGEIEPSEKEYRVKVTGWVWEDGERVAVTHQCRMGKRSRLVAMTVTWGESDTSVAQR